MTQLSDITKDFNDGLAKITTFVPKVVTTFQNADTKLRGQEDNLINGYDVPFAGMGAMAFANATENNIQLASRVEQKLQEFVTASDNTNKEIHSANDQYESQIDNFMPPMAMVGSTGDPLEYYGYGWKQSTDMLRDGTLAYYVMIAGLFDFGLQSLLDYLKGARDSLWSAVTYQYNQNLDQYQQTYNQLESRLPADQRNQPGDPHKQLHDQQVLDEKNRLSEAKIELDQIYNNQVDAFTNWYNALAKSVENYKQTIEWTSATADVTVSDFLIDLQNSKSPIVIYKTPSGGLVVLVKGMNGDSKQNALLVQQAIAQYDALNNLNNPKVTILGYQGGGDIVQQLAHDNNPFQITNVMIVGDQVKLQREAGINYMVYAAPGDNSAGTGGASLDPSNPSNQAAYGVDAGEVVLGAATGGPWGAGVAFGEVVAGTVIPAWAGSGGIDVSGAANGGLYFQPPENGVTVGNTPPINDLTAVPIEPGMASSNWGWSWNFPYVRVNHVNYMQSSFLSTQGIPDPNGDGKLILSGVEPLSPPTYYNP